MENSTLQRFMNSHEKLICELRNEIDYLRPVVRHHDSLVDYKCRLIAEMESLLHKSRGKGAQNQEQLKEIMEKISDLSVQKKVTEIKYRQLLQKYQVEDQQLMKMKILSEDISTQWQVFQEVKQKKLREIECIDNRLQQLDKQKQNIQFSIKEETFNLRVLAQSQAEANHDRQQLSGTLLKDKKSSQKIFEELEKIYEIKQHLSSHLQLIQQKQKKISEQLQKKKEMKGEQDKKTKRYLQHLREYEGKISHISNIFTTEASTLKNLLNAQKKAQTIMELRIKQIERTSQDIVKYSRKIEKRQEQVHKKQAIKEQVLAHLASLQNANQMLYQQIREVSCADQQVTHILKSKSLNTYPNHNQNKKTKQKMMMKDIANIQKISDFQLKSDTFDSSEFSSTPTLNDI